MQQLIGLVNEKEFPPRLVVRMSDALRASFDGSLELGLDGGSSLLGWISTIASATVGRAEAALEPGRESPENCAILASITAQGVYAAALSGDTLNAVALAHRGCTLLTRMDARKQDEVLALLSAAGHEREVDRYLRAPARVLAHRERNSRLAEEQLSHVLRDHVIRHYELAEAWGSGPLPVAPLPEGLAQSLEHALDRPLSYLVVTAHGGLLLTASIEPTTFWTADLQGRAEGEWLVPLVPLDSGKTDLN